MDFPVAAWKLLPHRPPMVLLDTVLSYDPEEGTIAEVEIGTGSPFFSEGGVPAWVGIEYMAQCIAAFGGCEALSRGEQPPIGFLLGTRHYAAQCPVFPLNTTLLVRAKPLFNEDGMGAFACSIEIQGEEVAAATINTFTPKTDTNA